MSEGNILSNTDLQESFCSVHNPILFCRWVSKGGATNLGRSVPRESDNVVNKNKLNSSLSVAYIYF
jgi:hypothetical protein